MRMGRIIGVKPEKVALLRELYAHPWPDMEAALRAAGLSGYTLYLREPEMLLVATWDYVGADYEHDAAKLSESAVGQRWNALITPCLNPLTSAREDDAWVTLEPIYRLG